MRSLAAGIIFATAAVFGTAAVGDSLLLDAALAGDAIVAVGERGLVQRSTDGGDTWTTVNSGVSRTLCAITFLDQRNGWAAGHGAIILRTEDGGKSWQHQFTGDDDESPILDIMAISGGHVIAVGAFGAYYESRNSGADWEQHFILEEDMHLNRISRSRDGTLWLAGEFGALLRSRDSAKTWQPLSTGEDGSLYGVLPLTDGNLIAYGLRGRVYRSTDDGETWNSVETPGTGLLMTGIELASANTLIVTGQARTWWVSRDGGQTFTATIDDTPAIAELLLTPTGHLVTFGEAGSNPAPSHSSSK
ncbi:YCF48-related protein [Opitutaceae bacterium]|nr:YCF48-related protein [Opitutaceae bacterium]